MTDQQMIEYFASKQDLYAFKDEMMNFKDNMEAFKDEVITVLDQQTAILRRLDEERVFTHERINRLEEKVETHDKDISELKIRIASA